MSRTTDSTFEVATGDGRKVRHVVPHREGAGQSDLDHLRSRLGEGYSVTGQVFDADEEGRGGWVMPIRPGSSGPLATLLDTHGEELLAWLESQGFRPSKSRS